MPDLLIPSRFCGPPSSGNGGYSAGAVSAYAGDEHPDPSAGSGRRDHARPWPTVQVSLRRPPPLDTPLPVTSDDGGVVAADADGVVLAARCVHEDLVTVEAVPAGEAAAGAPTFPGLENHPFPTCFGCGPGRDEGDGLRIFPGRVTDQDGRPRVAATWTPHPSVAENYHSYGDGCPRAALEVTWAALDCVGGWAGDLEERLMVLARMTARIDSLPAIGEEYVLVGLGQAREGRKTWTASTMYDPDGRVVGTAEHLWVAVDPAAFS